MVCLAVSGVISLYSSGVCGNDEINAVKVFTVKNVTNIDHVISWARCHLVVV